MPSTKARPTVFRGHRRNHAGPNFRPFGSGAFERHQLLIDATVGADALDDFLAEIAALGEADGVHLLRFLRQGGVRMSSP